MNTYLYKPAIITNGHIMWKIMDGVQNGSQPILKDSLPILLLSILFEKLWLR